MTEIKFFEPVMCCSTGVCGPSPDQELIRVTQNVEKMKAQGIKVFRYNLTSAPKAFIRHEEVMKEIKEKGDTVLPIIVANDEIIKQGSYLTDEEVDNIIVVHDLNSPCCEGDSCC